MEHTPEPIKLHACEGRLWVAADDIPAMIRQLTEKFRDWQSEGKAGLDPKTTDTLAGVLENYATGFEVGTATRAAEAFPLRPALRIVPDTADTESSPGPSADPAELLRLAQQLHLGLTGRSHPYDTELTEGVLAVVAPLITEPGYAQQLRAFAGSRLQDLQQLNRDYGHGTPHDRDPDGRPGPRYVLVRQPEGLIVAELLTRRKLTLAKAWEGALPDVHLHDLAMAWGVSLPHHD